MSRTLYLMAGLAVATIASAQDDRAGTPPPGSAGRVMRTVAPDYFPLAVGNLWLYQGSGFYAGTYLTLQITGTQVYQGNTYYLLHGFSQDYWLRENSAASVLQYDSTKGTESVWWNFASPLGQHYTTSLPGNCCGVASIASSSTDYSGPLGRFQALQISYPGVFQVGISQETFLPGIGLAQRTQATGGPSTGTWELMYARVGGVTFDSAAELSFGLSLDSSSYTVNMMPPVNTATAAPLMTVRLRLRNTSQPIQLTFPSTQDYDFTLTNSSGTVVYRWSSGRGFGQVVRTLSVGPGETDYMIQLRLNGADGNPLPAGRYVAEGWLATSPAKMFDASAAFQVSWAY